MYNVNKYGCTLGFGVFQSWFCPQDAGLKRLQVLVLVPAPWTSTYLYWVRVLVPVTGTVREHSSSMHVHYRYVLRTRSTDVKEECTAYGRFYPGSTKYTVESSTSTSRPNGTYQR